ncbi:MAG: glycosyltransferase family 2 protein [Ruminococcaceae bacterium]|nr:glycosyltransferase family 2 protein [Oscillospiraceae bacterium]
MDNNIKVSVVMPIYNAGQYLASAISSVLSQTLTELELICVDDGSTDNSLSIVREMQTYDDRIRILTENNAGPSIARNKGLARARGEFIIFFDADDFCENTLLQSLYEIAVKDELDMAVAQFDLYNSVQDKFTMPTEETHANIFTPGAVVSKNEFPDYILESATGYVWNKLFRTSFIREKELSFDTELYVFEDVHFVCTALSLAERIGRVEGTLIHHRVYSEQSRAKLFRKYYAQVPVVYSKIKKHLMHYGMYIPLSKSFLNLSAGRCYKIYNLLWDEAKGEFWNLLHDSYADSFGWYNHEKSDYENKDAYEFVANVGLYTHEEYLARIEQGKEIDVERLDKDKINRMIKEKDNNKKTRVFTKKLFKILWMPVNLVLKIIGLLLAPFKKKKKEK